MYVGVGDGWAGCLEGRSLQMQMPNLSKIRRDMGSEIPQKGIISIDFASFFDLFKRL